MGTHVVLIAFAAIVLIPFLWMVLTSFKSLREAVSFPPVWLPSQWRWENYVKAWESAPLLVYYANSIIVGVAIITLQTLTSAMAAYALVFLKFRGKNALFLLIVSTIIVPQHITYIPNYLLLHRMGMLDTYWALIIPFFATGLGIFLIRQGLLSLPSSLFDAAVIDGANHWQLMTRVMLPLVRPSIITFGLFNFVYHWNEFMWPLLATNSVNLRVLPVGMALLLFEEQTRGVRWERVMAANVSVIVPLLIVFAFTQRWFVKSVADSAVKG